MADRKDFFSELCDNPYFSVYWCVGLPTGEAILSMKCRLPYGLVWSELGKSGVEGKIGVVGWGRSLTIHPETC